MTTPPPSSPEATAALGAAECTCDGPGPQGEHREWCELGHPNHECDPRMCQFAVRCDGYGIGTPDPCVLAMGHPGECEA